MKLSTVIFGIAAVLLASVLAPPSVHADDIDIFLGNPGGSQDAPNIVFLLDNDSNYASASQKIPPLGQTSCSSCPKVGQSEVDAIIQVIAGIYNGGTHLNVGLAMLNSELGSPSSPLSSSACTKDTDNTHLGDGNGTCNSGTYMRFGVRDMAVLANFTAFANVLGFATAPSPLSGSANALSIYTNLNDPTEKINSSSKDSAESLYEVYRYFQATAASPIAAFGGKVQSGTNPYADYNGHNVWQCPKGQGLASPYAMTNSGDKYVGPPAGGGCAKNYIIHIVNPDQSVGSIKRGHQMYQTTSAGTFVPTTNGLTGPESWVPSWAKFLKSQQITTYVVAVYQANPPSLASENVLKNEAAQGGGKYYIAKSEKDLLDAINKIVIEIQSVNSAFAATALPASATNRSVDQNQVYLGIFRPDPNAGPRWFGNLKRFQIILNNGAPDLGDAWSKAATNATNGFLAECQVSFWSKDTSAYKPGGGTLADTDPPYWSIVPDTPSPLSGCIAPTAPGGSINPASNATFAPPSGVTWDPYSDVPDGPFVEKGGVAEVVRSGNGQSPIDWNFHRTLKTLDSGGAMTNFPTTTTNTAYAPSTLPVGAPALPATNGVISDFVKGYDSNDENGNLYTSPNDATVGKLGSETRPSLHGDVVHGTPLPVTYNNTADGVVVYYGTNDGIYRAVNANTGVEKWGFVAPEFLTRFERQYANTPLIRYPGMPLTLTPKPRPKDYFWDGSTGLYQSNESPLPLTDWIFPTQRRGGRMIYAFNVSPVAGTPPTPPATPTLMWKAGCPNLDSNTGCTTGMDGIGQTWSKPQTGKIKNGPSDTTPRPMVIMGGGYDSTQTTQTVSGETIVIRTSCDDENTKTPSCGSRKGKGVYIIDAQSGPGTLLKSITLPGSGAGSVPGDIALLDYDGNGEIDYAYLADTTGNVYRIDFVDRTGVTPTVLDSTGWTTHIYRIAHTNTGSPAEGRKFMFGPTLLLNKGPASKPYVYVGLGSGDREHPIAAEYPYTSPVLNRFYMFLDDPTVNTTDLVLDGSLMENATPTVATSVGCPVSGSAFPTDPHAPVLPQTFPNPSGWYMDMANDTLDTTSSPQPTNSNGHGGEQTVTPAVILGGQVSWGSNIPNPNTAPNSCVNTLGNAYGYLVDLTNGSGAIGVTGTCGGTVSTPYAGGGLPLPPTVGTVAINDPGSPTGTTYIGICIGCPPKGGGTGTTISPTNPFPTSGQKRKRIYWFTPNYGG